MKRSIERSMDVIRDNIMRDMSEGVVVIGFDGVVTFVNPAAERILGTPVERLLGSNFMKAFFESEVNDDFAQTVLDAVYDKTRAHDEIVPLQTDSGIRQLHMVTSFLQGEAGSAGIIIVLDDITELAELKIEYAAQVTGLLDSLVEALSSAIDERSHYNANHTRNMVRYAERFLDWLKDTGSELAFEEQRRRVFLMSIGLHDVGKLAVPLSVMNKATRLGPALETVTARLREIGLLDRIAFLEGRIDGGEKDRRDREREAALELILRINGAGFLSDEDLAAVEELSGRSYVDGEGQTRPWLTEAEQTDLRVRRGTLTDAERDVMQSHVVVTERILSHVSFPEIYAQVPKWAAAHHELLNGTGYPHHLTAPDIPWEVRLLTVLDVFEALTASDRPYKGALPPETALGILHRMADEGGVDPEVLSLFASSRAWEKRSE